MTDEKKKDKKDGKEAKKVDDEQLKDVAGGTRSGRRGDSATGSQSGVLIGEPDVV